MKDSCLIKVVTQGCGRLGKAAPGPRETEFRLLRLTGA